MKITRTLLATIMHNAWTLARYGVTRYGGTVKQYFSIALTIAWKEAREKPITAWSKEHGNRYLLPGLDFSITHNGQILLPGLQLK